MKNKLYYTVLFSFLLIGCNNISDVVPFKNVEYSEKYHCFPYDVKVYKVLDARVCKELYLYPNQNYCSQHNGYKKDNWIKLDEYMEANNDSIISVLKGCVTSEILFNQFNNGDTIFFAGSYRYFLNMEGEKIKVHDKFALLNVTAKTLYLFKDIQ